MSSNKRNVEIKACIKDINELLEKVKSHSDTSEQIIHQEDHFFNAMHGRLKLRILEGDKAQLISYERDDKAGPKLSKYSIAVCEDVENLKTVLSTSLGIKGSVKKTRHLFFIKNTRIHVDEVESLGDFIEFEVVLDENQTEEDGKTIAYDLMKLLGVQESDLICGAYMDMILSTKK